MNNRPVVVKVGGNELDKPGFIPQMAKVFAEMTQRAPCILVHGGGRAIDEWLKRMGIQPTFVEGLRVTDEATMEVVEALLSGRINKHLVLALTEAGVDALGMCGVDRSLIRAEPISEAMGRAGKIVEVRGDVLVTLCAQGLTPVISPVSAGKDGCYNVNADHVASAIARAVNAARLVFVSNVPGVKGEDGVIPRLSVREAHDLIAREVITGGMIPKVNSALEAIGSGVNEAIITDLSGLGAGTGTVFAG